MQQKKEPICIPSISFYSIAIFIRYHSHKVLVSLEARYLDDC